MPPTLMPPTHPTVLGGPMRHHFTRGEPPSLVGEKAKHASIYKLLTVQEMRSPHLVHIFAEEIPTANHGTNAVSVACQACMIPKKVSNRQKRR